MSETEGSETFLSDGASGLADCSEVVSGLAGGLYTELEQLILAHGEGAVTGLVPLAVTALETLESLYAETRARAAEVARAREEAERLLAHYERERAERKRTEERFLELEDCVEHERKTHKSCLELAASQTRQMETKARSYADMMFQLETDKLSLDREHSKLLQNYNTVVRSLKDIQMQQRRQQNENDRQSGSPTPVTNKVKRVFSIDLSDGPSSLVADPDQGYPDSYLTPEDPCPPCPAVTPTAAEPDDPPVHADLGSRGPGEGRPVGNSAGTPGAGGIGDIVESAREFQLFGDVTEKPVTSTPRHSEDGGAERNTDSILQELQSLGPEFVDELDSRPDIVELGRQLETFALENEELSEKYSATESARRSLVARVEELTGQREELRKQLGEAQEGGGAAARRVEELEAAVRRAQLRAGGRESGESEDGGALAAHCRPFTRAEMSRVITERNLYKERLLELQEAVRRMDVVRALKQQQRSPELRKSSVWDRLNRLLGLSSVPPRKLLDAVPSLPPLGPSPPQRRGSGWSICSDDGGGGDASSKEQRRELYHLIRAHVWREHGRAQVHGWSLPHKLQEASETSPGGLVPVPALVRVRLLDQKDPSTKLWCATGVELREGDLQAGADHATEPREKQAAAVPLRTVWICSGTHSDTEVMVVDAEKASHVLEHFALANCRVLCAASVPAWPRREEDRGSSGGQSPCSSEPRPHGGEEGTRWHSSALPTVWLGSQSGSLFIHSSYSHRRLCLHSIKLGDSIYSIVYTGGCVVVTLGNGTVSIFRQMSDGIWDVKGYRTLDLGLPRQSVRCAVPVSGKVWCGYRNRVYVVNPRVAKIEKWFEVAPHVESQVQHLACVGEGVWVSVRLNSMLRLFHARSGQPLQVIDVQPFVSRMFGSGPLGLSFLQVTAMSVFCKRLWVGTGTGFVVSVPLSAELEAESTPVIVNGAPAGQEDQPQGGAPTSSIPYCLTSHAQICFHGHHDAVRFFVSVSVPDSVNQGENPGAEEGPSALVMSGGEGYINFRLGDDAELSRGSPAMPKAERSHLIVWQART